ncbi:MAG: hypothetical protein U5S82_14800 [Gammaproteobacteria bacterium]|nr:hypothetical protein [Gammaproteobacteria bacterium]
MVTIDNIERPLEGATLCQILTQTHRRVRPLGTSTLATVPCTMTLAATGNNLVLRGDIVRRALVCRFDAGTERPELRVIDQDLIAEVRDRRRDLVGAIVTLLVAHADAGYPSQLSPLGGYAEWSRTVRAALVWAGTADPVDAMNRTRDADPSRQDTAALFRAWHEHLGTQPARAADLISAAETVPPLADALAAVSPRGVATGRSLGYWLRAHRDRRAGGLVLTQGNLQRGAPTWVVAPEQWWT